jgi:2-oxoglutarate dehydrogenase E1 component
VGRILDTYRGVKQILWVQEEPRNRGAWSFISDRFERSVGMPIAYVGREESASPATGSPSRHEREQKGVVASALSGLRYRDEDAKENP